MAPKVYILHVYILCPTSHQLESNGHSPLSNISKHYLTWQQQKLQKNGNNMAIRSWIKTKFTPLLTPLLPQIYITGRYPYQRPFWIHWPMHFRWAILCPRHAHAVGPIYGIRPKLQRQPTFSNSPTQNRHIPIQHQTTEKWIRSISIKLLFHS